MIWPTPPPICRRIKVCRASGMPLKVCSPLSTPPMREPRPPARIRPVMSCAGIKSTSDVAHFNAAATPAGISRERAAQLGIAVAAALPDVADGRHQVGVRGIHAQQRAQVVPLGRKQAQKQLALSGKPGAIAFAAKGLRHTADDADFSQGLVVLAQGVGVAPTGGGLARLAGFELYQG